MIVLDTNFMIAMVSRETDATDQVRRWMQQGRSIATSSVAWSEFCTGPIAPEDRAALEWVLEDRIISFGKAEAECAAKLYRSARCKREDRIDTFIAAATIMASAALATRDHRGFRRFVPHGLVLA
jgi:predicted nucleic acid-binding protein